jgi:heme-degrading monooxygenase HmoA
MISETPKPPYYAVIFTSIRTSLGNDRYNEMSDLMFELAKKQDGFLGVESCRDKLGITVSYWKDLASIKKWRENTEHSKARNKGRQLWYSQFKTRICKVERDYEYRIK